MTVSEDTSAPKKTDLPLKEACVVEAMNIIREKGLEQLSLRDVARRLKVSHQAPYKHFASKDALLAEVIRRCLRRFAKALESSSGPDATPIEAMASLGRAYLSYAAERPLEYRLMFMTPWPPAAKELGLDKDARAGFDILATRLAAYKPFESDEDRDKDAMFVWSTIHGVASLLQSESMKYLSFSDEAAQEAVSHAMNMVERAVSMGLKQ